MKIILLAGSISVGVILVATSFFAEQIGIDNDSGWGAGRSLILLTGIALILISSLGMVFKDKLTDFRKGISRAINKFEEISYSTQMIIFSLPVVITVIALYIWFAQPSFEVSRFNYYSQLAIAFKKHQVYLVEQPSSALLALNDPYDYELRKRSGIEDFPWDVSLYNDKFYLYWGPVPSLILVFFSIEELNHIGDEHLVLAFLLGLFIYYVLFSYSIWLRFNQTLPPWFFSVSILAIGLSAPSTWMLNSSRIYEGAIIGGQLFFIGGCYWVYSSLNHKPPDLPKLIIGGLHWAMALGTRISILPVILFATGMTLLYVSKQIRPFSFKSYFPALLGLCAPLGVAAVGLGWYNWERFNSVFEFGLKYQLASVNYTTFNNLFSFEYIYENLYNYLIHPLKFQNQFPYIQAIENTFSNERLAGLVYISPYILYSGLFIRGIVHPKQARGCLANWLKLTLAGSALISTLTILSYYFPATRFCEDFMPALLLLATASLEDGYRNLGNNLTRKVYIIFTTLVVIYSVIASSLIAFPPHRAEYAVAIIRGIYKFLGFR